MKINKLSIFEWLFYTGFTVLYMVTWVKVQIFPNPELLKFKPWNLQYAYKISTNASFK